MITSQQTSLLSELRQTPIPEPTLVELLARLENRIHSMILDAFNKSGRSQKELAARIGWDEARVSRCLGTSSNFTLKTISALMAAIGVDLDGPTYTTFDELEQRLIRRDQIAAPLTAASAASTTGRDITSLGTSLADIGAAWTPLALTIQPISLPWLKKDGQLAGKRQRAQRPAAAQLVSSGDDLHEAA